MLINKQFKTTREYLESDYWANYISQPENQDFKVNPQQLAKTPIFLDCLVAPQGYRFVQLDFAALEPNVLAEFSGDPCYKDIYASGKPHDAYFYVSCKLLDNDGKLNAVYNLDNPTKETVKAAKKQFKRERSIGKVFQLMSTYKAGAPAIHRKLKLNGVDISKDEVVEIRNKYWGPELFGTVLDFEDSLLTEVEQRDGWMMNGLSRPFVVTDRKKKDVVNIFCQSTGHDCTDLLIMNVERLAKEAGLNPKPIIPDYHDETIWMIEEEHAEQLAQVMRDAVAAVNEFINFSIPLKGDPEITENFTKFKGPDPIQWYSEKVEEHDEKKRNNSVARHKTTSSRKNKVPHTTRAQGTIEHNSVLPSENSAVSG